MRRLRATWRRVPHGPRCKVCSAPFAGIGGVATRVILHGRSIANPTMCTTCFKALADHPGGTELEISVVFADIRGSTAIAETIGEFWNDWIVRSVHFPAGVAPRNAAAMMLAMVNGIPLLDLSTPAVAEAARTRVQASA